MAHKAVLPHPSFIHAKPARVLSAAEKLMWRRFLVGLVVLVIVAALVLFAPVMLSSALALGVFHGWDAPIDYD